MLGWGRGVRRHCRKGSTTSKRKGPSVMSIRSVGHFVMGPHRGVPSAHVDDGEGLRRAEVRVEGEADHDEQLAHLVLAGEPHALVGLGVGRPHDAHGIGRVVDEELVEAREGGVLAGGGVGRGHRGPGRRPARAACSRAVDRLVLEGPGQRSVLVRTALTVRSGGVRGPAGPDRSQPIVRGPIDPRDAAFFLRDDYFDVLARLRAEDPVHECAPGFWAVTPLRGHPEPQPRPRPLLLGAGRPGQRPDARASATPMASRSILHMDPPEHAAFRGLVNRRFTPRALSGLAESIRKSASTLLDAVEARDRDRLRGRAGGPVPA